MTTFETPDCDPSESCYNWKLTGTYFTTTNFLGDSKITMETELEAPVVLDEMNQPHY